MGRQQVLITGASGFIGRNLAEYLKDKFQIFCPQRGELDLLNAEAVSLYLSAHNFDVVIHAAGTGVNQTLGEGVFEANKKMFLNLTSNSEKFGRMIFLGSGAEYGKQRDIVNIKESDFGSVLPEDEYGKAKYFASEYIAATENIMNLRLFGVFGKYEDYRIRFISNAICRALYGLPIVLHQNTLFDYLYINDLMKIIDFFINHEPKNKFYNATSGQSVKLVALAEIVKTVCGGVEIKVINPGLGRQYTSENGLLKAEVTSLELTPVEQGVRELAKWYKDNLQNIDKNKLNINA